MDTMPKPHKYPTQEEIDHFNAEAAVFLERVNHERAAEDLEPISLEEATIEFGNLLEGMVKQPGEVALYLARVERTKDVRFALIEARLAALEGVQGGTNVGSGEGGT